MRFAAPAPSLALALALPALPAMAQTFDFDTTPDRVWLGREFWANRLQDWRVAGRRLECVETRKNLPMRTAQLLTAALGETPGQAEISVKLGPLDPAAEPGPHAGAGLLLGAGGSHVDYRLTAQVHHAPGEDGGMAVLVARDGSVSIRRNDQPLPDTPLWSIDMPVGPDQMPVLGQGMGSPHLQKADSYTLVVQVVRGATVARVTARTQNDAGDVLHFAFAEVEHPLADGGIALAATGGPEGSASGFWFDDLKITGDLVRAHKDRSFGPIWHASYTRGEHGLAMTAQLPPLAPMGAPGADLPEVELWVDDGGWRREASAPVVPDSWTAHFALPGWDTGRDIPYELRFAEPTTGAGRAGAYAGTLRAAPDTLARPYVIASLNCNKTYTGGLRWNRSGLWFPHDDLVANLAAHDPDLLYFSGDQIYEGDMTPADTRDEDVLCLDYLYKWTKWCWAFGPVTRDRPTITIPDDHDVYHGNIWGAGGRRARAQDGLSAQDAGGYKHSPRFVNAVHRTQVGNLPPTGISPTIGEGYTTYTTTITDAGVSFVVFADRMFKESPSVATPEGEYRNGFPQAAGFDARAHGDDDGVPLLGGEQEAFLHRWASDWSGGVWMKVGLSQSPFSGAHTLPSSARSDGVVPGLPSLAPGEYPPDDIPMPDADTNGWPRAGRDRAVGALRRGFAVHLAGDQHLSTLQRYGLEAWRDSGVCFTSPAIANTWPRRWFPSEARAGQDPTLGEDAPRYTGDFLDGFGNRLTMLAAANPIRSGREPAGLYDKAPGYGIVRLDRRDRTIRFECWARWVDPLAPDAACYPGWPVTMAQGDLCGLSWGHAVNGLQAEHIDRWVLTVRRAGSADPLYSIRVYDGFVARVPDEGPWDWEYRNEATGEVLRSDGAGATRDLDRMICQEQ
ncbi:MAG: hypothetical protein IT431_00415 [Phycisphaerales bacterium]|nr:hypothetical protein [Phycisphaerales bacterium]